MLCLHITDSDQTFMKQHWQAGSCNRNRAIQLDIVTATVLSGPHGDRTRSSLMPACVMADCTAIAVSNIVLPMPCIMFCFGRKYQKVEVVTYLLLMNESM